MDSQPDPGFSADMPAELRGYRVHDDDDDDPVLLAADGSSVDTFPQL